jgi:hypothetical protein
MVLGFISLILTFGQPYIAKICIPLKVANTMLPCSANSTSTEKKLSISHQRLLLADRRFLAAVTTTSCKSVSVAYSWPVNYLLIDSIQLVILLIVKMRCPSMFLIHFIILNLRFINKQLCSTLMITYLVLVTRDMNRLSPLMDCTNYISSYSSWQPFT